MSEDALKLTVYFGERDRIDGRLTSDALLDVHERHGLGTAILVRGTEGFGIKHRLHTQRLLTLSEDLPLVSIAVDTREAIEAVLPEVRSLLTDGLVTLERTRLVRSPGDRLARTAEGTTKLTLYLGRHERIGRLPAYRAVVDTLRRHDVAGATVLLGVDGLVFSRRARARFVARNVGVPLVVEAVGSDEAIHVSLDEVSRGLERPTATLERVVVCKRDGIVHAEPRRLPESDTGGLGVWQKLTLYAGERTRAAGRPLYVELIQRLRREGAAGATAVRGIWGYSGDHAPHGDRFLTVRRSVPVLATVIDRPERMWRWWQVADELTPGAGLVTSERVPAFHAFGPGISHGGLELAEL